MATHAWEPNLEQTCYFAGQLWDFPTHGCSGIISSCRLVGLENADQQLYMVMTKTGVFQGLSLLVVPLNNHLRVSLS